MRIGVETNALSEEFITDNLGLEILNPTFDIKIDWFDLELSIEIKVSCHFICYESTIMDNIIIVSIDRDSDEQSNQYICKLLENCKSELIYEMKKKLESTILESITETIYYRLCNKIKSLCCEYVMN